MPEVITDQQVAEDLTELWRLERDVIEKAMARHRAQTDYWEAAYKGGGTAQAALDQADKDLRWATLALEEFESRKG